MKKNKFIIIIFFILSISTYANANQSFEKWKTNFSKYAISQGVSEKTLSYDFQRIKEVDPNADTLPTPGPKDPGKGKGEKGKGKGGVAGKGGGKDA